VTLCESVLLSLFAVRVAVANSLDAAPVRALPLSTFSYQLSLTSAEFSFLRDAAQAGVAKYGGDADFNVRIANTGSGVAWYVTITNPKLMQVLDYWMAERISTLVGTVDFKRSLSDSATALLETAKVTHAKVKEALANPIWDPISFSGVLTKSGASGSWSVVTDSGLVRLNLSTIESQPSGLEGHEVLVRGAVRTVGQLDATRIIERKRNTLELFVMSLCPFGKKAEHDLISRLQSTRVAVAPALQVHYIFYIKKADSTQAFASMHGEEEVREDLVQMLVRDEYPKAYWSYLLLRAESSAPWEALGRKAGLLPKDVEQIRKRIASDRDGIIRREYSYVAGTHGIYDGSPTFVWEGAPVRQVRDIPFFSDVGTPTENCSSSN
jgi:hypothetical protein